MSYDEELFRELMESFREELGERITAINSGLLALEQEPEREQRDQLLEELFRHVHSLKGAARAVDFKPIEDLAHGMEDVFGAAKRGSIQLTPILFDRLYQGLDLVGRFMAAVEAGQEGDTSRDISDYLVRLATAWREQPVQPPLSKAAPVIPSTPSPGRPAPPAQPWSKSTIRVPTARLDALMAQTGELLVTRLRVAQRLEEIKQLQATLLRWQRDWQHLRSNAIKFLQQSADSASSDLSAFLERNEEQIRSLTLWTRQHARRVADDAAKLSLVTDELEDGVKRTRMLPLSTLLSTLRRTVRDLAREKGLDVLLQVQGSETEMDKHILEQIQDPLLHLLRNCIDHGFESPQERVQQGKPAHGTISLNAERRGNSIVVEVADDGRGLDLAAIGDAAVRRGLLSPETAAELSLDQLSALIFSSGLSTSPIITEVSGRGIGLDVVRKNVEALQGTVAVSSQSGAGTTFTLSLPLTLVSTHCLLIRAAGETFALPLSSVEHLIPVRRGDIALVEGKEAIPYQGRPFALARLADVLDLPDPGLPDQEKHPALILSSAGQRIVFLVDKLLSEQEVVVKSLGQQLARVPNVAGATVLGTGEIVLILNVADLIKSAQRASGRLLRPAEELAPTEKRRPTILVVDDSITTRTLEKNILSTAGYEVHLATDGHEALAVLAANHCDLIVADIDMPRLDGFDLTSQLKQDERYRQLPVILVTSLDSPEDKARGIAVGADAYIIKSTFDQDNLLEAIEQLI